MAAACDKIVSRTQWRTVLLGDERAVGDAIAWWEALTGDGGEGMMIKPREFVARGKKDLMQAASHNPHSHSIVPGGLLVMS